MLLINDVKFLKYHIGGCPYMRVYRLHNFELLLRSATCQLYPSFWAEYVTKSVGSFGHGCAALSMLLRFQYAA